MTRNKIYTLLFSLSLSSIASQSIAAMPDTYGVGLGIGGQRFSTEQIAINNGSGFPSPMNVDIYQVKNQHRSNYLSLFAGYTFENNYALFNKNVLALNYRYHLPKTFNKQSITLFSLPTFTNYLYTTETSAQMLTLLAKTAVAQFGKFSPYLQASAGVSFNRVSRYHETALPGVTPRISPSFAGNTSSHFAYTLGTGIDWVIGEEITLSAGYEFQDLGSLQSGNGTGSWANQRLNYGDLTHHSLLLTLTLTPIRSAA